MDLLCVALGVTQDAVAAAKANVSRLESELSDAVVQRKRVEEDAKLRVRNAEADVLRYTLTTPVRGQAGRLRVLHV